MTLMLHTKNYFMKNILWSCFILLLVLSCNEGNTSKNNTIINVKNASELTSAIKNAEAGNHIVMADGVYKDIEIAFFGKGTEKYPIVLSCLLYTSDAADE